MASNAFLGALPRRARLRGRANRHERAGHHSAATSASHRALRGGAAWLGWISGWVSRDTRLITDERTGSTTARPTACRAASTPTAPKVAGAYLVWHVQESAWREDHRRAANGEQVRSIMGRKRRGVDGMDLNQLSAGVAGGSLCG